MSNWYALYTRPGWEKRIAERLFKRKIESYCPISQDYKLWDDLKKVMFTPLFPCYLFVRTNKSELISLKNIEGVINLVFWQSDPVIIRDIEIEMIKRFLNEHKNVYLEKSKVNMTDIVRIINSPLIEEDGNVVAVSINKIKLILPSLGYSIIGDLLLENIEVINLNDKKLKFNKFRI